LLADRAAAWNAQPEDRQLPSLVQWAGIRWWTSTKDWTPPQRNMMRRASRYHVVRGVAVALVVGVLTLTGLVIRDRVVEQNQANHAAGLVQQLLHADSAKVPGIIAEIEAYRLWA